MPMGTRLSLRRSTTFPPGSSTDPFLQKGSSRPTRTKRKQPLPVNPGRLLLHIMLSTHPRRRAAHILSNKQASSYPPNPTPGLQEALQESTHPIRPAPIPSNPAQRQTGPIPPNPIKRLLILRRSTDDTGRQHPSHPIGKQ